MAPVIDCRPPTQSRASANLLAVLPRLSLVDRAKPIRPEIEVVLPATHAADRLAKAKAHEVLSLEAREPLGESSRVFLANPEHDPGVCACTG